MFPSASQVNEDRRDQKVLAWLKASSHSYEEDRDETLQILRNRNVRSALSQNQEDFDVSLAREMSGLSFDEVGRINEDIHGVPDYIEETPELIRESLRELHHLFDENPFKSKAFFMAIQQNESYVMSREFGLIFLRAEKFDTQKACQRLLFFLDKKLQYFGEGTLTRRLQLRDLSLGARKTLKRGSFQLLPFRDRTGRIIIFESNMTGERRYDHVRYYVSSCQPASANPPGCGACLSLTFWFLKFEVKESGGFKKEPCKVVC